jgi:hypothetical protein
MTKIRTQDLSNCIKNNLQADITVTFEFTEKGMKEANLNQTHSLSVTYNNLSTTKLKDVIDRIKSFKKRVHRNIHLKGDYLIPFGSCSKLFPNTFIMTHESQNVDIRVRVRRIKYIYMQIVPHL